MVEECATRLEQNLMVLNMLQSRTLGRNLDGLESKYMGKIKPGRER